MDGWRRARFGRMGFHLEKVASSSPGFLKAVIFKKFRTFKSNCLSPEGAHYGSPGQRPGKRTTVCQAALKGRPKNTTQSTSNSLRSVQGRNEGSLARPFRAEYLLSNPCPGALPRAVVTRPFGALSGAFALWLRLCRDGLEEATPLGRFQRTPRRACTWAAFDR